MLTHSNHLFFLGLFGITQFHLLSFKSTVALGFPAPPFLFAKTIVLRPGSTTRFRGQDRPFAADLRCGLLLYAPSAGRRGEWPESAGGTRDLRANPYGLARRNDFEEFSDYFFRRQNLATVHLLGG